MEILFSKLQLISYLVVNIEEPAVSSMHPGGIMLMDGVYTGLDQVHTMGRIMPLLLIVYILAAAH